MPINKKEKGIYAFLTVLITVHAFVFYSLYVINGEALMTINNTNSVIEAINNQGGILVLGTYLPIWAIIVIEICFAFTIEMLIGGPLSFKITSKTYDLKTTDSTTFETAIIRATVTIMCPIMSFIATFLYYPYYETFNIFTFLANWLKLICFNFPFAYFTQLFFIQPLVRTIFKKIYKRN